MFCQKAGALMRLIPWKALSDAVRDEDLGIQPVRLAHSLTLEKCIFLS